MHGVDTTDRLVADRYALGELLGRGGMGQVWRAEDVLLGREVAVKEVALPLSVSDEEREVLRARVMREARAAARLNHQASVTVFDVVEDDGNIFLVMELVECGSLADLVTQSGTLSVERASGVGLAVLDALAAAHATGVVHRDVKPSNVLVLEDGSVKLTDFGIASLQDDPRITSTGMVLGSPSYMAPEQAEGRDADPATDIWGLGATLYFAVEGAAPFGKGEPLPTMHAVVHEEPRPFQRAGALAGPIAAMLAKDPRRRPDVATVRRLLDDARTGGSETTVAAEPVATTQVAQPLPSTRVAPPPRRSMSWLVVGLVVLLVAGVLFFALRDRDDESTADAPPSSDTPATTAPNRASTTHHVDRGAGYEIDYPAGWSVQKRGTTTDFRAPDGTYLRVDWTSRPGPSPVQAWRDLALSFAQRHANYRELGIRPVQFKGHDAAEWEFTYTEGGAELRAVDLGLVTGERGYALYFQSRADRWNEYQPVFERMKASFSLRSGENDDGDD